LSQARQRLQDINTDIAKVSLKLRELRAGKGGARSNDAEYGGVEEGGVGDGVSGI